MATGDDSCRVASFVLVLLVSYNIRACFGSPVGGGVGSRIPPDGKPSPIMHAVASSGSNASLRLTG